MNDSTSPSNPSPSSDQPAAKESASDELTSKASFSEETASPLKSSSSADSSPKDGSPMENASTEAPPSVEPAESNASAEPALKDVIGHCSNCDAALTGPYCAHCGQRAASRIVPVWHMTHEVLEDLLNLDLRVLKTLPTFFFLPGRLTREYIEGRRQRYVRPLRLYLFSSFLLFTLIALVNLDVFSLDTAAAEAEREAQAARARAAALSDSLTRQTEVLRDLETQLSLQGLDSMQTSEVQAAVQGALQGAGTLAAMKAPPVPPDAGETDDRPVLAAPLAAPTGASAQGGMSDFQHGILDALLDDSLKVNLTLTGDSTTDARLSDVFTAKAVRAVTEPTAFFESATDKAPYLMFILLPFFALILKVLYARRGRFYIEHLIFALHFHALAFFAFALSFMLGQFTGMPFLQTAATGIGASPFLYLLLAMMHVYRQGVLKTSAKMLALLWAYGLLLFIGFLLLAIATVLLM